MRITEDDVSTLIRENARMTPDARRRLASGETIEVTLSSLTDFANAVAASLAPKKVALALSPELKAALDKAAETGATFAETPDGICFINRGHDYGENASLECPACSGSGHVHDFAIWAQHNCTVTDNAKVEALVREYGNTPICGPGRVRRDVLSEILTHASAYPAHAMPLAHVAPGAAPMFGDPVAMLRKIVGFVHPCAMPRTDDTTKEAYARLRQAFCFQQPWPIPDQAAIVWRSDLMRMHNDLTHKQAFFDHHREKLGASS